MRQSGKQAIRLAGIADAEAIARVHISSWQDAYDGIVPPEQIPTHADLPKRCESWQRLLEGGGSRERTWVGLLDSEIVGFANAGPSRDEDADSDAVGELRAIYLLRRAWRRGLGRALNAAAERFLEEAGFAEATLWVLAANASARGFYEAAGWRPDGSVIDSCGDVPALTVRYRRRLRRA